MMSYSWKTLRSLAGLKNQIETARVLDVSPATVVNLEKAQSVLYFKWLVAEAALRQGVSKVEIHKKIALELKDA